ncbi:hypothetical protein GGE65_007848 [Skermanella aerolata]|uniref:hypothetical protein n=1 Tax=Skermanella aerolata TaxID=393310 RepID=UPI003D20C57B
MPPRTNKEYGDTSYTGIPDQLLDSARKLARDRNIYPRDVFTEAVLELIPRLDAGDVVEWPKVAPAKGGKQKPYHTRLEVGVLEAIRNACDRHEVKGNVFFIAALRDYLRKNGYATETQGAPVDPPGDAVRNASPNGSATHRAAHRTQTSG